MKKQLLSVLLLGVSLVFAGEGKGYEIAKKSDQQARNFVDEKNQSKMTLIDAKGRPIVRNMVTITLEDPNQKDLSIIQFLNPADVRGTSLLTHQNPKGDDKQWLYLPELRKVKKISSKNKSGSFMGSEFTYEDISANALDKWTYKFIEETKIDGKDAFLIEKVPNYKNSGYSKVKMWITKENYLLVRQEYFDRKKTLMKVQLAEWTQIGKVWRFSKLAMENLQTGKKSILEITERKLKTGLKKSDFNKRALQRLIKL